MLKYIIKRILLGILTLFVLIAITFSMTKLMPGSPLQSKNISGDLLEKYELDAKKRQDLMLQAEKVIVSDDTCIVPLFTNNNTNLTPPELENYYYDVLAYPNYKGMRIKSE